MTEAQAAQKPKANALPHPDEYYAMRILVPVANPNTAPALLKFAAAIAHPERGRVIALFINQPDSPYKDAAEKMEGVCKRLADGGMPLEFVSITSSNVPRGVLDVVRERNADVLVLGFRSPSGEKVVLGEITEAIARVVPNDLIVYRHIDEDIQRIIVPITTLEGSRVAMIHALHLSHMYQKPVFALFVRDHRPTNFQSTQSDPFWLQRARIYDAIHELPDSYKIDTEVIHAEDLVSGINKFADEHDLVVFSVEAQTSSLDRWVFGATAQKMLRLAPGPLALVRRGMPQPTMLNRLSDQIVRLRPTLTVDERTEVVQQASDLARANTNFIVMILLSSILASVGLLQSSGAVIIGAMLVAPLMSPLMGFGVGLALGNIDMMRRSTTTVFYGIGLVLLTSTTLGLIFPLYQPTAEMAARGQPNLLDLFVALASGGAGAFAMARRDIPAALAGVAIAAALVPPICTTGLALAAGNIDLMVGAGALSTVNIIGISVVAAGVFAVMGVHQTGRISIERRMVISVGVLMLMAIPLGLLLQNYYLDVNIGETVETVIEEQLPDVEVIEVEIDNARRLEIIATVRSPEEITQGQLSVIEAEIEAEIDKDIDLEIVTMSVVRSQ